MAKKEDSAIVAIENAQYINALERILTMMPTKAPENWDEAAFDLAKRYARIIVRRLKAFTE